MSGLWWLSVREHRRMTWSASRSHHPTTTQRCTHQPTTTQTHGCPSVVNLNQHMAALYCECLQITNKTPMIHKLSIWKPNDRLKWANWSKNRKKCDWTLDYAKYLSCKTKFYPFSLNKNTVDACKTGYLSRLSQFNDGFQFKQQQQQPASEKHLETRLPLFLCPQIPLTFLTIHLRTSSPVHLQGRYSTKSTKVRVSRTVHVRLFDEALTTIEKGDTSFLMHN